MGGRHPGGLRPAGKREGKSCRLRALFSEGVVRRVDRLGGQPWAIGGNGVAVLKSLPIYAFTNDSTFATIRCGSMAARASHSRLFWQGPFSGKVFGPMG